MIVIHYRDMKNPWTIIGIITLILFGGAVIISGNSTDKNNEGVEVKRHILGDSNARIKLVEYSDFQCPSCKAFHPVVKTAIEQYGEDLSFEYKNFPLSNIHPNALSAAIAAEAAGQQDKFFEFHDLLFEKQEDWSAVAVPNIVFIEYAKELGLNEDDFKRHLKSTVLSDKVKEDFDVGRSLDVTGTPTFFLNDKKMQFESYQEFLDQIAIVFDPSAANKSNSSSSALDSGIKFGI